MGTVAPSSFVMWHRGVYRIELPEADIPDMRDVGKCSGHLDQR